MDKIAKLVDKIAETCGQERGDLWTRKQRLVDKRVVTCCQGSGYLWTGERRLVTREQRLVDKGAETCGQENGDLWTRERRLVDKEAETCGQENGDLWTREWRLVDKRAETCRQENGDLWTREWRLVDKRAKTCGQESETCGHFPARYTNPVHSTYTTQNTDNSASLYRWLFKFLNANSIHLSSRSYSAVIYLKVVAAQNQPTILSYRTFGRKESYSSFTTEHSVENNSICSLLSNIR